MSETVSLPLPSLRLATTYRLSVAEVGKGMPSHLVIVLDGDDQFKPAVAAAAELAATGQAPPLLLVGVGYGGSYRSPRNLRGRDYTPTRLAGEPMETGGADAFHGFLAEELLPWIAARHPLAPVPPAILGHSLGALFVLHAAFQPRPLFGRFLAGSPSIWWDERVLLTALRKTAPTPPPFPVRLFLSVGEDDSPSMTGDLTLLETQLASFPRPGLIHTVERFAGHDHYTALPTGFRQGLRWLFAAC